ncbi:hypothetical protein L686_05915 [Stutzerimonas stutzeri MF28]|nr:hypothetical protein L686_05915 [Stutzerimonas stutzeri MF28]
MAVSFLSFCGRPDLGAKLLLCAGRKFCFRRGGAAPTRGGAVQAMAVSFLSFCGRPDLGAKLLLCAGRELVFAAGARLPHEAVPYGLWL